METVVVYDSKFGNTRKLAEIMAKAIETSGKVRVFGLETLLPEDLGNVDLLIVGGPTQSHGLSPRMRQFTDVLTATSANGAVAATFDTRYRMPEVVSGTAAKKIARRLKRKGIHVFQSPESFFVTRGGEPQLETGADTAAAKNDGVRSGRPRRTDGDRRR